MHFFSFFMTSSTSLRNSWSTSVIAVADVGVAYDEVIGGEPVNQHQPNNLPRS